VDRAVAGSDHVINLVGLLFEGGKQKFSAVHEFGARAVAEAARAAGVSLTHMSAIGADPRSHSAYASTKGRAEAAVHDTLPDAIIIRPSIVFGPEDSFFNKFAGMARISPFLPLIGGGHTRFQPVYVGDVAEVFARSVDGTLQPGNVYELGGGEVLTFKQCLEEMLRVIGRKRMFVSIPFWIAKIQGSILGYLPKPPLTRDQVLLLQHDNVVSNAAKEEGRTLEGLGIRPQTIETILPSYLWRFRSHGQYSSHTPA
jgi:uncharacterized protein YbjT (DUF2867 family)